MFYLSNVMILCGFGSGKRTFFLPYLTYPQKSAIGKQREKEINLITKST